MSANLPLLMTSYGRQPRWMVPPRGFILTRMVLQLSSRLSQGQNFGQLHTATEKSLRTTQQGIYPPCTHLVQTGSQHQVADTGAAPTPDHDSSLRPFSWRLGWFCMHFPFPLWHAANHFEQHHEAQHPPPCGQPWKLHCNRAASLPTSDNPADLFWDFSHRMC